MMEIVVAALVKGLSAGVMIGGFLLGLGVCLVALAVLTIFVMAVLS